MPIIGSQLQLLSLPADPINPPVAGDIYYNTTLGAVRLFSTLWATVGGSSGTPTTMSADFTVAANTQVLFRQPIVLGSHSIVAGSGATLIGV